MACVVSSCDRGCCCCFIVVDFVVVFIWSSIIVISKMGRMCLLLASITLKASVSFVLLGIITFSIAIVLKTNVHPASEVHH